MSLFLAVGRVTAFIAAAAATHAALAEAGRLGGMIGNWWLSTWETSRLMVVATESTSLVTSLSETELRAQMVVSLLELN